MIASPVYIGIPTTMEASTNTKMAVPGTSSHRVMTEDTSSDAGAVDMRVFGVIVRMLGFLIGIMAMAADISGHFLILQSTTEASVTSRFVFTGIWSAVLTLVVISIFALLCGLFDLTLHPGREQLMKAVEMQGLLWVVVGLTGGYTVVDFYFLPVMQWWRSIALMATFVGMFKLLMCWSSMMSGMAEKKRRDAEDACREPLMIVNSA